MGVTSHYPPLPPSYKQEGVRTAVAERCYFRVGTLPLTYDCHNSGIVTLFNRAN